jgi:hypothetical protein
MSTLTFDEQSHTYRVDGIIYPSVTQVLNATGIMSNFDMVQEKVLTNARNFGTAVHFGCELDDTDDIKKYHIDDAIMHCIQQWRKLKQNILKTVSDEDPDETIIEKTFAASYGYAGKPDRVYAWVKSGLAVVIDLKTGVDAQGGDIQTAGYAELFKANSKIKFKKVRRFIVHLIHDEPEGKIEECKDRNDWNIFLSALNTYKYRQKKGLL